MKLVAGGGWGGGVRIYRIYRSEHILLMLMCFARNLLNYIFIFTSNYRPHHCAS